MDNNGGSDVLELMGYTNLESGRGLDPDRVIPFVRQLIAERDALNKRLEHLSSLTRLIEKTIGDADDLAKQIEQEAHERAQADVQARLDKAEEEARHLIESRKNEAIAAAEREVVALKTQVQTRMEDTMKAQFADLKSHLRTTVEQLYKDMLAHAESLKEQTGTFESNLEKKFTEITQQFSSTETRVQNAEAGAQFELGVDTIVPAAAGKAPAVSQPETGTPVPVMPEDRAEHHEEVEVEILPPRDQDQIDAIQSYIAGLSGVSKTEMTTMVNKTTMRVSLNKQIDLAGMLQELPEIMTAEAVNESNPKRINVTLSIKAEMDAEKNRINNRVNRIFSEARRSRSQVLDRR